MHQSIYSQDTAPSPVLFKNATGKLKYTLTNDYLFRATLQRSKKTLTGVAGSVLGLKPEQIISAEIRNPIILGENIDAKDFVLDVRVLLNNNTYVNLEMQVVNHGNWPERSLQYLCRSFDHLNAGDNYLNTKPVIQVCFLDFTLFQDNKEFFSTYMFTNIKNHRIYSDKLKLIVIDLTCIELATEEDKLNKTNYWAQLFKATTWEEIKMLAANNTILEDAAETVYRLSEDEKIRMQCEAREDFYRLQRTMQIQYESTHEQLQETIAALQDANATIQEKSAALQDANATIQERDATIQEKDATIAYYRKELEKYMKK